MTPETTPIAISSGDKVAIMRIVVAAPKSGFSVDAAKSHGFALGEDGIYRRELTDEVILREIGDMPHDSWRRVTEDEIPADRSKRDLLLPDLSFDTEPPPRPVTPQRDPLAELDVLRTTLVQKGVLTEARAI